MKCGWVYILCDKPYGVVYIGVTSDLQRRIHQHREELLEGFTKRYHVKKLIHYEQYECIGDAILREKRLKEWKRSMKIDLIEKQNPRWEDLYTTIV